MTQQLALDAGFPAADCRTPVLSARSKSGLELRFQVSGGESSKREEAGLGDFVILGDGSAFSLSPAHAGGGGN